MGASIVFDQLIVFFLAYSADSSFVIPANPKFTRRRFIEGGLARHPLGGLKDNVNPCLKNLCPFVFIRG